MKRFVAVFVAGIVLTLPMLVLGGCGGGSHAKKVPGQPHAFYTRFGQTAHQPGWGHPPPGNHLQAPQPLYNTMAGQDMYDTISATVPPVPWRAQWLAGYTAGHWPTYSALVNLGWHPHVKSISIASIFYAHCGDFEPGDMDPSQVVNWFRGDVAHGFAKPCIYSSFWQFKNQIIPNLARAGIGRNMYWAWDANYTYSRHIDAGFDATQYTDHAFNSNLDATAATPAFLGIRPGPVLPLCYRHRIGKAQCNAAKTKVAGYKRAATSSQRAYVVRGCPGIKQREDYFAKYVKLPPASKRAYRAGALAASKRAYARNQCGVFASRVGLFTNLANQTEAAN